MLLRMTDAMGVWVEDVAAQRSIPMATVVRQYIADGLARDARAFGWDPYVPSPGDEDVPPGLDSVHRRMTDLHTADENGECAVCHTDAPCLTLRTFEGTTP